MNRLYIFMLILLSISFVGCAQNHTTYTSKFDSCQKQTLIKFMQAFIRNDTLSIYSFLDTSGYFKTNPKERLIGDLEDVNKMNNENHFSFKEEDFKYYENDNKNNLTFGDNYKLKLLLPQNDSLVFYFNVSDENNKDCIIYNYILFYCIKKEVKDEPFIKVGQ